MNVPAEVEVPEFTKRLRELISGTGLRDAEFARRVGISHQSLHLYRHGYRVPSPRTVEKIADACSVTVAWLRGDA